MQSGIFKTDLGLTDSLDYINEGEICQHCGREIRYRESDGTWRDELGHRFDSMLVGESFLAVEHEPQIGR